MKKERGSRELISILMSSDVSIGRHLLVHSSLLPSVLTVYENFEKQNIFLDQRIGLMLEIVKVPYFIETKVILIFSVNGS